MKNGLKPEDYPTHFEELRLKISGKPLQPKAKKQEEEQEPAKKTKGQAKKEPKAKEKGEEKKKEVKKEKKERGSKK